MKKWNVVWQNIFMWLFGGALYYCVELLYRGHSHWSMFLLGGGCFWWIDFVCEKMNVIKNVFGKMALSAIGITFLEWITGCVLNIWMKMDIWDYSKLPMQIMGQVCLIFSFFWFLLSFPAMKICKSVRVLFFE